MNQKEKSDKYHVMEWIEENQKRVSRETLLNMAVLCQSAISMDRSSMKMEDKISIKVAVVHKLTLYSHAIKTFEGGIHHLLTGMRMDDILDDCREHDFNSQFLEIRNRAIDIVFAKYRKENERFEDLHVFMRNTARQVQYEKHTEKKQ